MGTPLTNKPDSQTIAFWERWNETEPKAGPENAIKAWRRQSIV
jgi:hypothetical protein